MDLNQRKLTKSEWESIEVPVPNDEKDVLKLIMDGYNDVNIRYNKHRSLIGYLKVEPGQGMDDYLYNTYLKQYILDLKKNNIDYESLLDIKVTTKPKISKGDTIRIGSNDDKKIKGSGSFEYILIELIKAMFKNKKKSKDDWVIQYFTLYNFMKLNIVNINRHIVSIVENILSDFEEELTMNRVIERGVELIEKNTDLLKYADMKLYEHQRKVFSQSKHNGCVKIEKIADAAEYAKTHSFPFLLKSFRRDGGSKIVNVDDGDTLFEEYCNLMSSAQKDEIYAMPVIPPQLTLYIAPTGTGKTLSPIGLAQEHRIIFVCAARHVGLALAKSAISMGKKIAFAFGCSSAEDIRLHYFAAKEYTKHRKSGGIGKVDNSIGDKVEIMICDIKSYLPAMYYMLSFNNKHSIITYWDEPTIAMDYEKHDLHSIINKNWCENLIPNVILSSATLPKSHELNETIADFRSRFPGAKIQNIVSHDCKKSIPILSKTGRIVLPHYLSEDYDEILDIVRHCENNLTLLRYFDLKEVIDFILYVEKSEYIQTPYKICRNFASIDDINMQSIKLHYLRVLKNINLGTWGATAMHFKTSSNARLPINDSIDLKGIPMRKTNSIGPGTSSKLAHMPNPVYNPSSDILKSGGEPLTRQASQQITPPKAVDTNTMKKTIETQPGIYITTKDAFTLTDGPTIFLADNVEKIAKFCIQQANIPAKVMEDINEKIEFNNKINKRMDILEKQLEDIVDRNSMKEDNKDASKGKKKKNDDRTKALKGSDASSEKKLQSELDTLRSMIKSAKLNDTFVPNKMEHFNKWASTMEKKNIFTSDVDETIIIDIMALTDVADSWKVLLLMGIGVFTNHPSIAYTEIMKKMADEQRLYIIIASSDYIYGTNYQFCHGYLSKDLSLTQEKTIQALGRIGRNNIQQDYTIRLRDDSQITKLFYHEDNKIEVKNMNYLFNSETCLYKSGDDVDTTEA